MGHAIPDAALETHVGVLGKTGAGKSYTARGLVERLLGLRRHVVIVDPTGAWWGLRTGFDIPIFGGRKGDIEINDQAGAAVAGVIVEQRTSAIVDLSLMSGGAQRRFMRDFAHRVRTKEPGAFYLVLDEADEFLPQNLQPDMFQLFGDLKWIVRRGRLNGFRVMMITQRPAEIAKAVLTQIETLVAHRLTAPQDRKAIEDWVKGHHDPAEAREVLNTLASLNRGEAWVWCPDLNILTRSNMPAIETFDSGRTPEPGESAIEQPELGRLDLSAISEALNPPENPSGEGEPTIQHVEIARLRSEMSDLLGQVTAMTADRNQWRERSYEQDRQLSAIREILAGNEIHIPAQGGGGPEVDEGQTDRVRATIASATPPRASGRASAAETAIGKSAGGNAPAGASPTALAIADLLDRINPAKVTWSQAAAMVGRKASGGNFNSARKWLRESGRIREEDDLIQSASDAPAGMTWAEAIGLWKSVLSNPAPKMINALIAGPLDKESLGSAIGAQPRGGNFNNGLAQLRRNGLIVAQADGKMRLAQPLPGELI